MWGAALGAAANMTNQLLDGVLGLSARKERRQMENQKELAQFQAQLNYDFNEKAAENAFARQMEMYERSYEDQSYSAMRKQMEDAGLSVGMMYGGGGAGGSGGATTGAPQGGGAAGPSAGAAPNAAQMEMAKAAQAQNTLGLMNLKADLELKKAQKAEIEEQADKAKAEAGKITEEKVTEMQMRDVRWRNEFENAMSTWMKNNTKRFFDDLDTRLEEAGGTIEAKFHAVDEMFGEHNILYGNLETRRGSAEIAKIIEEGKYFGDAAKQAAAQAKYWNSKERNMLTELMIEAAKGDAARVAAKAQEIEAETRRRHLEYETGELVTWKTIADYGLNVMNAAARMTGNIMVGKAIGNKTKKISGRIGLPTKPFDK